MRCLQHAFVKAHSEILTISVINLKLLIISETNNCTSLNFPHISRLKIMVNYVTLEKNWCWEGLGAGGEGDDRGWDGWMASRTRWTWVWVNSGSWWWTGRPGVLWFMGSQRVGHDGATELNWKVTHNLMALKVAVWPTWKNLNLILVNST